MAIFFLLAKTAVQYQTFAINHLDMMSEVDEILNNITRATSSFKDASGSGWSYKSMTEASRSLSHKREEVGRICHILIEQNETRASPWAMETQMS